MSFFVVLCLCLGKNARGAFEMQHLYNAALQISILRAYDPLGAGQFRLTTHLLRRSSTNFIPVVPTLVLTSSIHSCHPDVLLLRSLFSRDDFDCCLACSHSPRSSLVCSGVIVFKNFPYLSQLRSCLARSCVVGGSLR